MKRQDWRDIIQAFVAFSALSALYFWANQIDEQRVKARMGITPQAPVAETSGASVRSEGSP
jgi:hypothetical protein